MYRDDEVARRARANALIEEIAALERERVGRAELDQRLEADRRELATLLVSPAAAPAEPRRGLLAHVFVFGAAAAATFVGYTLLF